MPHSYDVFISHAYEDKSSFVNELAVSLKTKGLRVWYSGSELKLGDNITTSVNHALKEAKFGIVIISPIYLKKRWAMNELNALFSSETDHNRILPILHNITVAEIRKHLPVLADRYAISSEKGMQIVTNKVLQVVKGKRKYTKKTGATAGKKAKKSKTGKAPSHIISDAGFITLGGSPAINAQHIAGRDMTVHTTQND